jgi:hypothetical protein
MREFYRYQRMIMLVILAVAGAGAAALAFFLRHDLGYLWGWLLGCAAGLVVFRARVASIMGMAHGTPRAWGRATVRSSLLQFGIVLLVLVVAALTERINLYACCAGVFMERVVLIADGLLRPAALADLPGKETATDEKQT